ncbi:hypothetical protein PoB_004691000 [Plakobranchus ocellatus]|uniref:Uncharacterized protein n=1 Tax=Plakobranchus ocellatus TaxID=259542 RepID=A0AAV4BLW0_9GAST|nr:hypothetical protein PoB_004691000 [Plakobranchus ocellatus]
MAMISKCCELMLAPNRGKAGLINSQTIIIDDETVLIRPIHNKVISGFQALRQARAPVAGLEPVTEGSLQISGRTR